MGVVPMRVQYDMVYTRNTERSFYLREDKRTHARTHARARARAHTHTHLALRWQREAVALEGERDLGELSVQLIHIHDHVVCHLRTDPSGTGI